MWEATIGLEIHARLTTKSKLFSSAKNGFGYEPNVNTALIDLAIPGTLPVVNKKAINMALLFGIAINANIASTSMFARKNYFYPDLPKGYQTSQMDLPIVGKGYIDISTSDGIKRIGITRAHLEEDAGKSIHDLYSGKTAIDLNRAGTPLLEIVSEPEMHSAEEAIAYVKAIHSLVRYLEICDGNMDEGSLRCDCNISVSKKNSGKLGTRCEIKNVNSFRFIEKAILGEIDRQIAVLEDGGTITQETRLYDSTKDVTRAMRSKEEAQDYRYFPCPDLLPMQITKDMLDNAYSNLPELPEQKNKRFQEFYSVSKYDAGILCQDKSLANFFEEVAKNTQDAKSSANWIIGDLSALLNKNATNIQDSKITAQTLSDLINRIKDGTISGKIAKTLLDELWNNDNGVDELIEKNGLKQVNNEEEITSIVQDVLQNNQEQVEKFKNQDDEAKKLKIFNFLVGQIMKASRGKANPAQVNKLLKQLLS